MLKTDPRHSSHWWRENWQLPGSWATCSRCGVAILRSHLADGVCCDRAGCDEVLARRTEPVAMARLADGSQVVAWAAPGLEVRAFTAEDLDERGMPWRKEYLCKLPETK